jgi:hypothetical protein
MPLTQVVRIPTHGIRIQDFWGIRIRTPTLDDQNMNMLQLKNENSAKNAGSVMSEGGLGLCLGLQYLHLHRETHSVRTMHCLN